MARLVVGRVSGKQDDLHRSDHPTTKSHGGSISPVAGESSMGVKFFKAFECLVSLRPMMLVVGHFMYRE
jgi:hypothetical protein